MIPSAQILRPGGRRFQALHEVASTLWASTFLVGVPQFNVKRGVMSGSQFINVANHSGLMRALGQGESASLREGPKKRPSEHYSAPQVSDGDRPNRARRL